jgi:CBS domain-containing protein
MMGGALGGLEATFLPNEGAGFWSLISMGAILGGTMRSPFTGIIFALELTHDVNALLPLLIAVVIAHGFTVLVMRRSILTEKVSRRGYHLSREYAVDPLEILFVREVMRTNIVALPANISHKELSQLLTDDRNPRGQHLYPVMDARERLLGVVTRKDLLKLLQEQCSIGEGYQLAELVKPYPVVAHPDEPLRVVVYRMAETGFTRFPVVERANRQKLVGMISLNDLLKARTRNLAEERDRERVLRIRYLLRYR